MIRVLFKIFYSLVFFILFYCPASTYAQRGNGHIEQTPTEVAPTTDFPGYFDTNMAPKGSFVLDVPFGAVDYGLSKRLTLGTSLLAPAYTTLSFSPLLYLKARYLFFSNKKVAMTLTGYSSYLHTRGKEMNTNMYLFGGTYNTAIRLNKRHLLTTQLAATTLQARQGTTDDTKYQKIALQMLTLAVGHSLIMNQDWSLENLFLVPVYFKFNYETQGIDVNASFKDFSGWPIFYRIFANYKTSPTSLLTFGLFFITNTSIGSLALPWVSWGVIF